MLLGRASELAAIEGALAEARAGGAVALLLAGAPGIGKTALLDAAFEAAGDFERVRIAGFEAESQLPWAGLASLLAAWPALAQPESRALREAVAGAALPGTAIGAALHAAIVQRSVERPVLLMIDDAAWLDSASAEAVAFACRRLTSDRVALVATRRAEHATPFPFARELAIGPLAHADSRALVRTRWQLPAEVVEHCVRAAEGNPLALLHVCGALSAEQRSGLRLVEASGAPPQQLARAFAEKLAALPGATLRALCVVALSGEAAAIAAALEAVDAHANDLLAAEAAGIIALGAEPRLTHPLWGAAILERGGPQLVRHAHAALADCARDVDRAALHRAASAERPSEAIARDVEAHALRCGKRGLPALAARAWADAARLSETPDTRARRNLVAAQAFWDAALPDAALAVLQDSISGFAAPTLRAGAVLLRNQIATFTRDARAAALANRDEALRIANTAPELELALLAAATVAALLAADAPLGASVAKRAAEVARDPAQFEFAQALRGYAAVHLGDGSERAAIERLEALAGMPPEEIVGDPINALHLASWVLMVRDRREACERTLRWLLAESEKRGLISEQAWASGVFAELEFRRGRWLDALAHASPDPFGEIRADSRDALRHAVGAHVLAHLGDAAGCRARAHQVLRHAEACGLWSLASFARAALGADALARGDAPAAVAALWPVWETRLRGGIGEAGVIWYQADLVEALAACGRRQDACEVASDLAANASAANGGWARAAAARSAALLALGPAGEALDAARALSAPFELARTQLALVEHGVCTAGDAGLREARAAFERLGARPWAERARARLGAAGSAEESLAHLLTEAELRVALLVARGATNAEAGRQLVLSVRTVDAHLRAVFRKLAITRRTQLALRVSRESGFE